MPDPSNTASPPGSRCFGHGATLTDHGRRLLEGEQRIIAEPGVDIGDVLDTCDEYDVEIVGAAEIGTLLGTAIEFQVVDRG